ncbi:hypothetical protein V8E55_010336 [Tylopilus felleus]
MDDITNVKPFKKRNDNLLLRWAQTQNLIPIDKKNLPSDVWTVWSCGLSHHSIILTFGHHNAEGAGTWVVIKSGVKLWAVQKITVMTRDKLGAFFANISRDKFCLDDPKGQIKAKTIVLYSNTLL